MKVEEQVALLNNKKIGIGVGTPARLMELIDNGKHPSPSPSPLMMMEHVFLTPFQAHCRSTSCSAWSSTPRTLTRRRGASWT